jgi:hypothetical protein
MKVLTTIIAIFLFFGSAVEASSNKKIKDKSLAQCMVFSTLSYSIVDAYYGGTSLTNMKLQDHGDGWFFTKKYYWADLKDKLKELKKNKTINFKKDVNSNVPITEVFKDYDMKDWKLATYLDANSGGKEAKKDGFFGVVFYNTKTKIYVVSFRGTNDPDDYLGPDKSILLKKINDTQIKHAEKLIRKITNFHSGRKDIIFTGHSLGGYIAAYLGAKYKIKTVTFNAPGFSPKSDFYKNYSKNGKYITNYIMKSDIIGNWGNHIGKEVYFVNPRKGDNHGIINFYDHIIP